MEPAEWRLVKTLKGHGEWGFLVAIGPDGKLLASGSRDGTVKLWSLPDGAPMKTLQGHGIHVSVAISLDGKLLASGDRGGSIRLWSLPDGKPLGCLIDLAASPDKVKGSTYTVTDAVTGQTLTIPCPAARRSHPARPARAIACRGTYVNALGLVAAAAAGAAAEAGAVIVASAWLSAAAEKFRPGSSHWPGKREVCGFGVS